jgi:methyl-accepting chemotaxis protein
MKLQNISIRTKLLGAFAVVCFLFLGASFLTNLQNKVVSTQTDSVLEEVYPHLSNFQHIQADIVQIQFWLTDISATRAAEGYDDGFAEAKKYYEDGIKRIEYSRVEHEKYGEEEMVIAMVELKKNLADYYGIGTEMAKAYIAGGPESGNLLMQKFDPIAEKLSALIGEIVIDHEEEYQNHMQTILSSARNSSRILIASSLAALFLALVVTFFFSRSITVPLSELVSYVQALEKGNLVARFSLNQDDEIGQLGAALKSLAHHNEKSITRTHSVASAMSTSIFSLNELSDTMGNSAKQVSDNSRTVASAVQQMDSNLQTIAASSEEASVNINMVAAATEEMSATVTEIADNAENAIAITKTAVSESEKAEESVRELGMAAQEINKVTETINEIADQTNLLALNATIEAARAGEAGKGFAVVANEIKDLASQTSEATREIKDRIDSVQKSSEQTIAVINTIHGTISKTSDIVLTMATAVQEQASASREIADNVSQASTGIQEVNENLAQLSTANSEVASDVSSIDADSDQVEINCLDVREQANELHANDKLLEKITKGYTVKKEKFNIGEIKDAHFRWKMQLSSALAGFTRIESNDVPDHHQCAFGKWYDNASTDLRNIPAFAKIDGPHQEVHRHLKEVLDLINNGQQDLAQQKLREFEHVRKELFNNLEELYVS